MKQVLNFSASWCGPCRKIAPFVEQLVQKYPSITFKKLDVDDDQESAEAFNVTVMPTFIFIHNDEIIQRIEGASTQQLEFAFQRLNSH